MPRRLVLLLGVVSLVVLPGAAPPDEYREHPQGRERLAAARTLALVTPNVQAYELEASGARVRRPDWSDLGRDAVATAMTRGLEARGFAVKPFDPAQPEAKEELRQVRLLYEAVAAAVVQATYANQFPWKVERFEYSLGDVGALADAAGADALVFTYAVANISSGGRVALQVLGARGSGLDWLIVGVVDRGGDLLWFGRVNSTTSDLRDPERAAAIVRFVTDRVPARPR